MSGGLRMSVAELAASGVLEHGRNRQRLAEAAGFGLQRQGALAPASPVVAPGQVGAGRGGRDRASSDGTDAPLKAPDINTLALAVLGEPRRLPRLEGEDGIQADIVFRFDVGTRARKWSIIPIILRNDIRVRTASDAELAAAPALAHWHQRQQRQAWKEGARAKAMGMRPGAPDLLLLSPAGFGFLECKSPGAGLRPEQRAWRDLCAASGWHWGLARSWDDALKAVTAWNWV